MLIGALEDGEGMTGKEQVIKLPEKCPECNQKLSYREFPDTRTSVDCYEAKCKKGHKFSVTVENQDNSVSITRMDD